MSQRSDLRSVQRLKINFMVVERSIVDLLGPYQLVVDPSVGVTMPAEVGSRIRMHVLPEIGTMPMVDVQPRHIRELIRQLIVPSSTGAHRNVNRGLKNFHYDLGKLGQRRRRQG